MNPRATGAFVQGGRREPQAWHGQQYATCTSYPISDLTLPGRVKRSAKRRHHHKSTQCFSSSFFCASLPIRIMGIDGGLLRMSAGGMNIGDHCCRIISSRPRPLLLPALQVMNIPSLTILQSPPTDGKIPPNGAPQLSGDDEERLIEGGRSY